MAIALFGKVLGASEMDVLRRLWQDGPLTIDQMQELLQHTRPIARRTVERALQRLELKELVRRDRRQVQEHRRTFYVPVLSRGEFYAQALEQMTCFFGADDADLNLVEDAVIRCSLRILEKLL